jgi:hypothetical protein
MNITRRIVVTFVRTTSSFDLTSSTFQVGRVLIVNPKECLGIIL